MAAKRRKVIPDRFTLDVPGKGRVPFIVILRHRSPSSEHVSGEYGSSPELWEAAIDFEARSVAVEAGEPEAQAVEAFLRRKLGPTRNPAAKRKTDRWKPSETRKSPVELFGSRYVLIPADDTSEYDEAGREKRTIVPARSTEWIWIVRSATSGQNLAVLTRDFNRDEWTVAKWDRPSIGWWVGSSAIRALEDWARPLHEQNPSPAQEMKTAERKRDRDLAKSIRAAEAKARKAKRHDVARKLKSARLARDRRIKEIKRQCRDRRTGLSLERRQALAQLREHYRKLRSDAKARCEADVVQAKKGATNEMEALRSKRAAEKRRDRDIREIRKWERMGDRLAKGRDRSRATRREQRDESDEQVTNNLPAELVPIWKAVDRKRFAGGPKISRTEQFLKWAEEHPDDVIAMAGDQAEREAAELIAELEAEQWAQQAEFDRAANPGPRRGKRKRPRANPAAKTEKKRRYESRHWGAEAQADQVELMVPEPTGLVALGELVSVVYRTSKGDEPLTDYEHKFSRPRPLLCEAKDGGLVIAGGGYVIRNRGIVR